MTILSVRFAFPHQNICFFFCTHNIARARWALLAATAEAAPSRHQLPWRHESPMVSHGISRHPFLRLWLDFSLLRVHPCLTVAFSFSNAFLCVLPSRSPAA